MDQILSRLETLKYPNPNESHAVQLCCDVINELNKESMNKEIDTENLIDSGFIEFVVDFFARHSTLNEESKRIICEVIAEIAKVESSRIPCSEEGIIKPLIAMLSENDRNVVMQSCRAIGNICYDNDIGRKVFADKRGIQELLTLMNQLYSEYIENSNKEAGVPNGRLLAVVSGCLLNSTNTFEYSLEIAIEVGLLDVLLKYLRMFHSVNEEIAIHCLLLLHCLSDTDLGLAHLCDASVLKELIDMLDSKISEGTVEALVEFFTNLSEDDDMKTKMTRLFLPQKLVELLNKNSYEDAVRKIILDFITLLLTEDISMNLLYDNGNGEVYKQCSSWINCCDDSMMKFAVLAIANFARSDTNCVNMVKDGIHLKLLAITNQNSTIDGDLRLQHACLSALRNLAIPYSNKQLLAESGLLDLLLKMCEVKAYPVVFKLLGTLRMLVDKQENIAKRVGNDKYFMSKLIEWCAVEEHPGVKGESVRLLASIVKNSKDIFVITLIKQLKGLPVLVEMINSEHKIMQNEALMAMALIVSIPPIEDIQDILIECHFGKAVQTYLKDFVNCKGIASHEILSNALVTIEMAAVRSPSLKAHLRSEAVVDILELVSSMLNSNNDEIKTKIATVVKLLCVESEKEKEQRVSEDYYIFIIISLFLSVIKEVVSFLIDILLGILSLKQR